MKYNNKTQFKNPVKNPEHVDGRKGIEEFVKANLIYPEEALRNNISGTVALEYDVDAYGKVLEVKVIHGIGYGCDEEAIRIVKLLKFHKKMYQGLRVLFHMKLNIHFRLPSSRPVEIESTQITYHYTPKEDNNQLGYTINL